MINKINAKKAAFNARSPHTIASGKEPRRTPNKNMTGQSMGRLITKKR
jgi:hypothetical protein